MQQEQQLSNTGIIQGLMEFALATSNAAQELVTAGSEQAASLETQRIVRIWREGEKQGVHAGYAHPTAAAIAADAETEVFALITAARAARDAIEKSNLSPEQCARAAMMLAGDLAPADSPDFIAVESQKLGALLPYDQVMRLAGKALVMACTGMREPLRPEMADFIKYAERLFSRSNFAPPYLGIDLASGVDQSVVVSMR